MKKGIVILFLGLVFGMFSGCVSSYNVGKCATIKNEFYANNTDVPAYVITDNGGNQYIYSDYAVWAQECGKLRVTRDDFGDVLVITYIKEGKQITVDTGKKAYRVDLKKIEHDSKCPYGTAVYETTNEIIKIYYNDTVSVTNKETGYVAVYGVPGTDGDICINGNK